MKVALGTMTWGAETRYSEARQIFELAWTAGVRTFDTAPTYNDGEAEHILADCLRGVDRAEARVMTKCAYDGVFDEDEPARSLERLGLERADVIFLHRAWKMTPCAMQVARDRLLWKQQALMVGLSNVAAWQVALTDIKGPLQVLYNLMKRQAEAELLPFAEFTCREVFAYSPLASGILAGDGHGQRVWGNARYTQRYWNCRPRVVGARSALAWVTQHPAVTAAIVGPRTAEQAAELLRPLEQQPDRRAMSSIPIVATDRTEEACLTDA